MTVTHWQSPELPDEPDELLPLEPLPELPELDPDDPLLELLDGPDELLDDEQLLDELPEDEELLPEDEELLLDEDEELLDEDELLDELELLLGRQQSYSFSYWNQYSIRASESVPKQPPSSARWPRRRQAGCGSTTGHRSHWKTKATGRRSIARWPGGSTPRGNPSRRRCLRAPCRRWGPRPSYRHSPFGRLAWASKSRSLALRRCGRPRRTGSASDWG